MPRASGRSTSSLLRARGDLAPSSRPLLSIVTCLWRWSLEGFRNLPEVTLPVRGEAPLAPGHLTPGTTLGCSSRLRVKSGVGRVGP